MPGIGVNAGAHLGDRLTRSNVGMPYEHHEIHDGDMFVASAYEESKADGTFTRIAILTGATYVHMFARFSASQLAFARIREAPTYTDNTGSQLDIWNRNRNSAAVPTVLDISQNPDEAGFATLNPTLTSAGDILFEELMGGGNRSGGESRADSEFILAPATFYVFEAESGVAGTALNVILNFYEKSTDVS